MINVTLQLPPTMGSKFNEGDKVRLLPGGPEMTIRGTHFDVLANEYKDNMYDCIWFELSNEGKREIHYCPFYDYELVSLHFPEAEA